MQDFTDALQRTQAADSAVSYSSLMLLFLLWWYISILCAICVITPLENAVKWCCPWLEWLLKLSSELKSMCNNHLCDQRLSCSAIWQNISVTIFQHPSCCTSIMSSMCSIFSSVMSKWHDYYENVNQSYTGPIQPIHMQSLHELSKLRSCLHDLSEQYYYPMSRTHVQKRIENLQYPATCSRKTSFVYHGGLVQWINASRS